MLRTIGQSNRFHKLISKLGIDAEAKADIVRRFTNQRESSSAKMHHNEMAQAILFLVRTSSSSRDSKVYRMKMKVLSLAHELGWEKEGGKIDYNHLNDWFVKYSPSHFKMDDCKASDLQSAITILEKMSTDKFKNK